MESSEIRSSRLHQPCAESSAKCVLHFYLFRRLSTYYGNPAARSMPWHNLKWKKSSEFFIGEGSEGTTWIVPRLPIPVLPEKTSSRKNLYAENFFQTLYLVNVQGENRMKTIANRSDDEMTFPKTKPENGSFSIQSSN
ncbi:MAG: hypothetical protein MUP52_12370 [Candidatus Aminicenantes bacterium]|nr:hypothetical protein [Candidatus Aminicenantes bacterium]